MSQHGNRSQMSVIVELWNLLLNLFFDSVWKIGGLSAYHLPYLLLSDQHLSFTCFERDFIHPTVVNALFWLCKNLWIFILHLVKKANACLHHWINWQIWKCAIKYYEGRYLLYKTLFTLWFEGSNGHACCTKVDTLFGATHRVYMVSVLPITLSFHLVLPL